MENLKLKDLSVGDWVMVNEKPRKISVLADVWNGSNEVLVGYVAHVYSNGHNIVFYKPIEKVNPIPITAEILEKNGFTLCEDCTSRWKKEFSSCCVFVTAPEGYASVTVYKRVAHGHRRVIDDLQLNGVHQLQRALRLAGVEKEIVL